MSNKDLKTIQNTERTVKFLNNDHKNEGVSDRKTTITDEPDHSQAKSNGGNKNNLVRVYSDTEKSNFNNITGQRLYDDLKYRPIHHEHFYTYGSNVNDIVNDNECIIPPLKKRTNNNINNYVTTSAQSKKRARRYSEDQHAKISGHGFSHMNASNININNNAYLDMTDEYIPNFDFIANVNKFAEYYDLDGYKSNKIMTNNNNNNNNSTKNRITSDHGIELENMENSSRSSSISSSVSFSEHSMVKPIKAPAETKKIGGIEPAIKDTQFWRDNLYSTTSNTIITDESDIYNSRPQSYNDTSVDYSKLPADFETLPFSQRKKTLLELFPEHDYKTVMNLLKSRKRSLSLKLASSDNNDTNMLLLSKGSNTSINNSSSSKPDYASLCLKTFNNQCSSPLSPILSPLQQQQHFDTKVTPGDRGSHVLGYVLGKIIGYGAWGIIRECYKHKEAAEAEEDIKAMKIIKFRGNAQVKESCLREVFIWSQLNNANILKLISYEEHPDVMFCLTSRIHGGTLYDLVAKVWNSKLLKYTFEHRCYETQNYLLQLLAALKYLHFEKSIVHGDIKLENCLITKKENILLLCDFGMSIKLHEEKEGIAEYGRKNKSQNEISSGSKFMKILQDKKLTHDDTPLGISSFKKKFGPAMQSVMIGKTEYFQHNKQHSRDDQGNDKMRTMNQIGSLPYAAPELLDPIKRPPINDRQLSKMMVEHNGSRTLSFKSDIWALGVMLYAMICGRLPFHHEYEPRLKMLIISGKYDGKTLKERTGDHHKMLRNVIIGCLQVDIDKRWSLTQVENAILDANSQRRVV
ncbi:uncharacterized protein SCODWIG_00026 [Saccharomycodes ludwigii]|uniref:Protein kinase domain-containing protein n=1 Tax=Saccharomycodes ludwigii TaxID=36035 RepID=A0A376B0Q1_9ASCO|nr:uncharacterized protein SCODWIG_00026 [Saccharomycodes ludwigii]